MSVQPVTAQQASKVSEEEAHAIGVHAYVYFYSLITMDVTRKQLTNVEPGKGSIGGPMNMFNNIPAFPTADLRVVVRPNFDTLYSSAWLDLTKEPVIVSVPDTGGRYYLIPMLDMWTDVFASPGWRTTGTQAGNFIIVPPGWRPDLKDRLDRGVQTPERHATHRRSDTVRLDHRSHQDGRSKGLRRGSQDPGGLQGHAAIALGQGSRAGSGQDRSDRRHEDPAEDAGRRDVGRQVFRLRSRTPEAASAAHHGSADHRA